MAKKAKDEIITVPKDVMDRVNDLTGIPGCIDCIRQFVESCQLGSFKSASEVVECLKRAMDKTSCFGQNPDHVAFQIVETIFGEKPKTVEQLKLAWHKIALR